MIMDNTKGDVRSNEVIGSRDADDGSACGAGTLNSVPIGQRCQRCNGEGYEGKYSSFIPYMQTCRQCYGTGREPLQEASGGSNAEVNGGAAAERKNENGT